MISEPTHRSETAAAYPAAGKRTIAAVSRFLFRLSRSTPISAYIETLQSAGESRKPENKCQVVRRPPHPHGPRPEKPYHDGAHTSTVIVLTRLVSRVRSLWSGIQLFCIDTINGCTASQCTPRSTVLHWLTPHESGHDWNLENRESRNAR